jgi:hypothetical protein
MDRRSRGIAAGGYVEPISIALGLAQATGLADKIGGLIGGKNGQAVADRVVDVAKLVTGMHDGRSALEEVQADPGAKVRLEEALIDREVELQKIAQEDRADARSMQVETLKADRGWLSNNFLYLMTFLLLLFAFGFATAVTFIELSPTGERYADLIMTSLVAGSVGGVVRLFYGGGGRMQQQQLGSKRLQDFGDYGR